MHQIRAVTLQSYLDVATSVGIDGLRLLGASGISPSALGDAEARLPAEAAVQLLERSAAQSGCDSFGLRMAEGRSFASMGAISLLLEKVQNIGEALETLSTWRRFLSDVLVVAIETVDDVVSVTFDLIPPFSRPQATDLTVGLGYMALAGASGGRWAPEAVHFTHHVPHDRVIFARFFQAPLVFNSLFNGFSFPTESLRIVLPGADRPMAENVRRLVQTIRLPTVQSPISEHAKNSLVLLLGSGKASLTEVAKNLSLNPRVLQRQLRSEGASFAGLLNEVRLDLALRQLSASNQSLTSLAQALGYADLSSFTRWFAREFGMSPSTWRKKQGCGH